MNVTANDVSQSGKRQPALLDYKVRHLLQPPEGGWFCPRWWAVEVAGRVGDEVTVLTITRDGAPTTAWIVHCRQCGKEYADPQPTRDRAHGRTFRPLPGLCRDCERKRDNSTQRRRRAWRRLGRDVTCTNCGVKIDMPRMGQRFCSVACRVAAHRAKKRELPA